MSEYESRLSLSQRLQLRWWGARAWLRRCPECRVRGFGGNAPRWEDDKIAQMLGIATYGCPCCGEGAIEERDAACDHTRCCKIHGTHSNPHMGCMLR